MFLHEAASDTAILRHEGESESEVKLAGQDRFGETFGSCERSSTRSVDDGAGNIGLDSVVAEGEEAFSSDLNMGHVHGVVNSFDSHSTSNRATDSAFLSLGKSLD